MPSPTIVAPSSTVALPAIGPNARAASAQLVLDSLVQSVRITLAQLPPGQSLGPLGTIYIDNTDNPYEAKILFPDTGCAVSIPANAAAWCLAVTGGQDFILSSAVAAGESPIGVQVLNCLVAPTGTQPTVGNVTLTGVVVAQTKPFNGAVVGASANINGAGAHDILPASPTRSWFAFQMPQDSDGWVCLGGAAQVGNGDSFYMQAGEKFLSQGFCPNVKVSLWLTVAGPHHVPCWVG